MRRMGTLRIATSCQSTLIPNETLEVAQYVEPSFCQKTAIFTKARTEYDYVRTWRPDAGDMYTYILKPLYTRSIAFGPSSEQITHAKILQNIHKDHHGAPVQSMKFELDGPVTSPLVSQYTDLASLLRKDTIIGDKGATRVGYSRRDPCNRPTDTACVSHISALAPPRVTHVSFGVAKDFERLHSRLDDPQVELPESLRSITFEHHHGHGKFPNKKYMSWVRNWIERSQPGGVEVRFACNKPSCEVGHNVHGGSTWRWDKEGEM